MTDTSLDESDDGGVAPKRVLALDGGGIRGLISLGILEELETRLGHPLSSYFDLIGGTSTGALIATKLAQGRSVSSIIDLYLELGPTVFRRRIHNPRFGVLRAKFPAKPLESVLERELGEATFRDRTIETVLVIVVKRLDRPGVWVLHNSPGATYAEGGQVADPMLDYRLTQALRASTAAPHYFEPIELRVGEFGDGRLESALFVDGGVSPHNNPALLLLMFTQLEGYGLSWPLQADSLCLLSVGTGRWGAKTPGRLRRFFESIAGAHATRSLLSMMNDASQLNETILQWMSNSPTARQIDRIVGDLVNDNLTTSDGSGPLLTYLRYDVVLEKQWLDHYIPELNISDREIEHLRKMDHSHNLDLMIELGKAAGQELITDEHIAALLQQP